MMMMIFIAKIACSMLVSYATLCVLWAFMIDVWPLDVAVQLGSVNQTHANVWIRCVHHRHQVRVHWRPVMQSMYRTLSAAEHAATLEDAERIWEMVYEQSSTKAHSVSIDSWSDLSTAVVTLPMSSSTTRYPCNAYKVAGDECKAYGVFCRPPSTQLSVLFGSCVARTYPPFHQLMAFDFARRQLKTDMALIMGDIVYTDTHRGLSKFGMRISSSLAWRRTFSDPQLEALLRSTPSLMMFDDHEIENDWRLGGKRDLDTLSADGEADALHWYDMMVGERQPRSNGRYYYSHTISRLASVFVLDTRSERSNGTLLGAQQWRDLAAWLQSTQSVWRFIVSPVTFTGLAIHSDKNDSWGGYPKQRQRLLSLVKSTNAPGYRCIILSGDAHWAAVYEHPDAKLWEINASPFQALPFPSPDWIENGTSGEYLRFFSSGEFQFGHFNLNESTLDLRLFGCFLDCAHPRTIHERTIQLE